MTKDVDDHASTIEDAYSSHETEMDTAAEDLGNTAKEQMDEHANYVGGELTTQIETTCNDAETSLNDTHGELENQETELTQGEEKMSTMASSMSDIAESHKGLPAIKSAIDSMAALHG
jgi:F0F1-type ATP synthase membrane subunit b/b'